MSWKWQCLSSCCRCYSLCIVRWVLRFTSGVAWNFTTHVFFHQSRSKNNSFLLPSIHPPAVSMAPSLNLSATLNITRLLYNPGLCLPHITFKSFDQLALPFQIPTHPDVKIKGVVLDKDNCFAKDHDDKVWPDYDVCWSQCSHFTMILTISLGNVAETQVTLSTWAYTHCQQFCWDRRW